MGQFTIQLNKKSSSKSLAKQDNYYFDSSIWIIAEFLTTFYIVTPKIHFTFQLREFISTKSSKKQRFNTKSKLENVI
jgi:hypothetical protein